MAQTTRFASTTPLPETSSLQDEQEGRYRGTPYARAAPLHSPIVSQFYTTTVPRYAYLLTPVPSPTPTPHRPLKKTGQDVEKAEEVEVMSRQTVGFLNALGKKLGLCVPRPATGPKCLFSCEERHGGGKGADQKGVHPLSCHAKGAHSTLPSAPSNVAPPSATTITTTATTPTQASEVRMFALWQPSAGHRDRLRLLPPLLLVRVVYAPPATMPRL